MTPIRFLALTAAAGLLTACGSEPDRAQDTEDTALADEGETAALDDAALHALLISGADDLVPSVWRTGEPAPDTALAYWQLPELDVDADRSAACTPLAEPQNSYECTLTFVSRPQEEAGEDRPVTARYRFNVREQDDGGLILLSPDVRWAVSG